jgi:hypothetical protein
MPIQNTSLSATRECTTQLGIEPNAGNATGLTYRHLDGLRANTEPQVGSDANLSTPHGCAREASHPSMFISAGRRYCTSRGAD